MTNDETWQQLLSLESRDAVTQWFTQLHARELSAQRARQITAAAKQAREYFRNARESAYSVRPLLTFYGVVSLSRALLLLLKLDGGEECLTAGHGLSTKDWAQTMRGDLSKSLESLHKLRISTTNGLFTEFIKQTQNWTVLHINSSKANGYWPYNIPQPGSEITLYDLFARTPDLELDYRAAGGTPFYSAADFIQISEEEGFSAVLLGGAPPSELVEFFRSNGYSGVSADYETFSKHHPLFMHTYVYNRVLGIPCLYIAPPFENGVCYSQLGITYMISYSLGMLVRYYPTHWISLIQGDKGDKWWPTMNRAQHLVEESYPELVIELIHYLLKHPDYCKPHQA